jgi:IMP dehydrogenase
LSVEENVREFKKTNSKTFVSVGASDRELDRFSALLSVGATYFCVDVAHGHAEYVGKMIKNMRSIAGANICIMAGNVATYAGADYLASVGADIIKVGIGPGSVCTTRIKTGFGVPQLSAIQSCARINRSIIADGGIKTAGDIVKALAFGADFVMIGGMLAGTHPTPGKVIEKDGVKYKEYRGMASQEAQESFLGQMPNWKTSEGVSTYVPYREDADNIIADIVGGIRSGLTYGGAATVNELQKKAEYMIVSPAGRTESLPHKTLK